MNLFILRHAIAMEPQDWKKAESDRPLTKEGIRKMKKAAKGLRRLDLHVDWVITSPFRRAYDTAQIAAKELGLLKRVKVSKMLAPDGDPKMLVRHLGRDYHAWENLMIVGHEPYLSQLAGVLAGGESGVALDLRKGGLLKLAVGSFTYGRCATLEWLLTPKLLKEIA